jgi:hypothetical protein
MGKHEEVTMTNAISSSTQIPVSATCNDVRQSCDCYLTRKVWEVFKENILENKFFHFFSYETFKGFFFTTGSILSILLFSPYLKEVFEKCMRGR